MGNSGQVVKDKINKYKYIFLEKVHVSFVFLDLDYVSQ